MNIFIITGASKGLGNSLLKELINKFNKATFIAVSRTGLNIDTTDNKSRAKIINLKYDLSNEHSLNDLLIEFEAIMSLKDYKSLYFINNAAAVFPISNFSLSKFTDIERNIQLNFINPLKIINLLLKLSVKMKINLRIINITSGLALNPFKTLGAYSVSKKSLIDYLKIIISEETNNELFKCISLDPGVMETKMQADLNNNFLEGNKNLRYFNNIKREKKLMSVKVIASKIVAEYILSDFNSSEFEKLYWWKFW